MIRLDPGENIIIKARKHWFIFAIEAIFIGIMAFAPWFFAEWLIPFFESTFSFIELGQNVDPDMLSTALTLAYVTWLLILWIFLFVLWTDYYLDVWVVTNKRIFDIEQFGLFRRGVSVFRLNRIQDLTIETHGLIATVLGFGDIHVQTAGADEDFIMKGIRNPVRIKRIIHKAHEKALKKYREEGIV